MGGVTRIEAVARVVEVVPALVVLAVEEEERLSGGVVDMRRCLLMLKVEVEVEVEAEGV